MKKKIKKQDIEKGGEVFKRWKIINKFQITNSKLQIGKITSVLLANRGIKTERDIEEFFHPQKPDKISLQDLGIDKKSITRSILRVKKALKNKEKVVIYGDYDADGVCATAILWEFLYGLGVDVSPYIPERFSEGYGINIESVKNLKLKNKNLKLIITVDNGIVAGGEIEKVKRLGIDVIVTDHHQKDGKDPKAYSVVHTPKICGSALAWIFAREIGKSFSKYNLSTSSLDLAAIGTIADQMSLISENRSFAKYGLETLGNTKRKGLLALYEISGIQKEKIGTYEVNFMIAPRINAMGRLEHAIDSLRILCTKSSARAGELARKLNRTNLERQKIVDQVVIHAKQEVGKSKLKNVIILAHESYHEGVIGLAAGKLVEKFYRPSIVISKGEKYSKASARSVSGFNIIETIRKLGDIIEGGGGHPMAAGFTILTDKIEIFTKKFADISQTLLTGEILSKKLKIDLEISFENISSGLYEKIKEFDPTGLGNPMPNFISRKVEVLSARCVGRDSSHLKLRLGQGGVSFGAVAFGMGNLLPQLPTGYTIDIVYNIEENSWNGYNNLELRIKDIRFI
jgi:single-stranded-DNA-specific exonuclease